MTDAEFLAVILKIRAEQLVEAAHRGRDGNAKALEATMLSARRPCGASFQARRQPGRARGVAGGRLGSSPARAYLEQVPTL
jgi:hypothetical protein